VVIFLGVVGAILLEKASHFLRGPNSIFNNPGQIWGGPNSVINNPGQIFGGGSMWTPALTIQAIVTVIFITASLFIVLSKRYASAERHWAYGALGTILGFWLRAA
jgi:hypothetical protein